MSNNQGPTWSLHIPGSPTYWLDSDLRQLVGRLIEGDPDAGLGPVAPAETFDQGPPPLRYSCLDAEQAFAARWGFACQQADLAQKVLLDTAVAGGLDLRTLSEEQITALMTPRHEGFDPAWIPGGTWEAAVPLVVVVSDFAGYRQDNPIPRGEVYAIDPTDDLSLLQSAAQRGLIEFEMVEDSDIPPAG